MTQLPKQRFNDMPQAQQAGMICNDQQFQNFAAISSGFQTGDFNASASAEFLRNICQIDSRAALNTNKAAQSRFAALRTDFDAWAGKIARPD